MKYRYEEESNYKSIWLNSGKTLRFAIDPNKPITDLKYPEFFDIKITSKCTKGNCKFCYQNSKESDSNYDDVVNKLETFFKSIPDGCLPHQIAYGGGEPTDSPYFNDVMRLTKEDFDICPNFTTNGTWVVNMSPDEQVKHLEVTKKYCGGVALSTHEHLEEYWKKATDLYLSYGIRTNFHHIISDKESIDRFLKIFEEYKNRVEYFVLLPYTNVGRGAENPKTIDWEYLVEKFPKDKDDKKQIAFGAKFYPYLKTGELDVSVDLYEPEIMSKFLDLKDMALYGSSFDDAPIKHIKL